MHISHPHNKYNIQGLKSCPILSDGVPLRAAVGLVLQHVTPRRLKPRYIYPERRRKPGFIV